MLASPVENKVGFADHIARNTNAWDVVIQTFDLATVFTLEVYMIVMMLFVIACVMAQAIGCISGIIGNSMEHTMISKGI